MEGRKEYIYLTIRQCTIHIYQNRMVRRLSLRLNIAASVTATENDFLTEIKSSSANNVQAKCLLFVGPGGSLDRAQDWRPRGSGFESW